MATDADMATRDASALPKLNHECETKITNYESIKSRRESALKSSRHVFLEKVQLLKDKYEDEILKLRSQKIHKEWDIYQDYLNELKAFHASELNQDLRINDEAIGPNQDGTQDSEGDLMDSEVPLDSGEVSTAQKDQAAS